MIKSVRDVQVKLKALGFDPGPVDGIRGRKTIRAVKAFQQHSKLVVDGIVGPNTLAELFKLTVTQQKIIKRSGFAVDATPWMDEAKRKMGMHEKRNHKALWAWLKSDGSSVGDPAKIPWCGDFVETCIAKTLPDEPLPNNPYWARNWAKFGVHCQPVFGAIASFKRGSGGHVGFVVAIDYTRNRVKIRGGNQSNAVTETWISMGRMLDTRWPSTALPPNGKAQSASSKGAKLSTNEE